MTGAGATVLVLALHAASAGAPVLTAHEQEDASASRPVPPAPGAPPDAPDPAQVAAAVRDLEVTDLSGRRWTLGDLRGRVVLLDFWATWCAPCLADLPRLKALRARHPRDRFEILGISLDVTSRRSFVSWLNRHRIEWPQVHERAGFGSGVPQQFGVDRLPRTVVISADGEPVALDVRGAHLVALIDHLVGAADRPAPGAMPR